MPALTTEQFIERAKKIHGDRYDYSKVVYKHHEIKIEIICYIHGSFLQTPHSHMRGRNCRKCSNIIGSNKQRTTIEDFINRSNKVYDNKYDYSKSIYVNKDTKLIVICPKHGEFESNPYHHLNGKSGCPNCKHKQEGLCTDAIEKFIGKQFHSCWPSFLNGLQYDGYNEELKLAFEYHGEQHYKPIKFYGGEKRFKIQQERDAKKRRLSK